MTQKDTSGLLRFGHVCEYDPARHMGRVQFPAMNGIISGWLPVLVPCSNGNKTISHIDIGTHVACLMSGEGHEVGVIAGAFYDDTNKPADDNMNIWRQDFSDGTSIQYDRENHRLTISGECEVKVEAENVNVSSSENVKISASGNTDITAGGNISIKAGNVSITYGAGNGALDIKSPGKITLDSGGTLDVNSSGSMNIKSPGKILISGSTVKIEGLEK